MTDEQKTWSPKTSLTPPPKSSSTDSRHFEDMKIFCKQMLKTRIFKAHYQEKRYVDCIKQYRDLIVISNAESEFARDVDIVRNRILRKSRSNGQALWVGFTDSQTIGAPAGSCIWTELGANIPFGEYMFQVKTVRFRQNEVIIKLNVMRTINEHDSTQSTPYSTTEQSGTNDSSASSIGQQYDAVQEYLTQIFENWTRSWYGHVQSQCTVKNVVAFLKFLSLFFVAMLAMSVEFVKHFGFFSLRFMEESNKLLHTMMPFLLGCLDLISKMIGGFYILIAMIWRDSTAKGRGPRYDDRGRRFAIEGRRR